MADVPPQAAPLLQYADAPARHGIIFETTADGLMITIPVPLPRQLLMLAGSGGVLALSFIIHTFVGVAVVAGVLILAIFRRRLGRPMVIELDARELRLLNVNPGEPEPDRTFRRADVYDVKFVRHSGNLVVRVHGQEILEVRPSDDPAILEWLADTLHRALWPQPPSENA